MKACLHKGYSDLVATITDVSNDNYGLKRGQLRTKGATITDKGATITDNCLNGVASFKFESCDKNHIKRRQISFKLLLSYVKIIILKVENFMIKW